MSDAEPMHGARPFRVYPILAVGVMSIAVSAILIRYATDAPGLAVAVWRTVIGALLLAPAAVTRIRKEVRRFSMRDVGLITGAGILLGMHFITWIESLYHTTVASASVLVSTSPIFIAAFGLILLKERPSIRVVLAIGTAVLGIMLLAWGDAVDDRGQVGAPLLGNGLALTASLLYTFYLLIGRVVRQKVSWLAYVFPLYCVTACTTLFFAYLQETPLLGYEMRIYVLCGLMALIPQIFGHGAFNYAVKYFPAALLGLLTLLEPLGATLLAYLFFREIPSILAAFGLTLVILSVAFALWPRSPS